MKTKLMFIGVICALIVAGSLAWAESGIPSLVGTWNTDCVAGLTVTGDKPSPTTHHVTKFSTFTGTVVIEEQKGRVFAGYVKTKRATEKLVGVIALDNKTFHYVDSDGFVDGKIITPDKLEVIYRHARPSDSVAAVGIYNRQK